MSDAPVIAVESGAFPAATIEFLDRMFPSTGGAAHWNWKFRLSPAGEIPRAVARDGTQVIGHLGMVALPFRLGGSQMVAALPADFAIDPAYRAVSLGKGGLIDRLRAAAFRQIAGRAEFAFMIPIQGFYALARRHFHYQPLQGIPVLQRDLGWVPGLTRRRIPASVARLVVGPFRRLQQVGRNHATKGIHIRRAARGALSAGYDGIAAAQASEADATIYRSAAYLSWRYLDAPFPAVLLEACDATGLRGYLAFRTVKNGDYRFCHVLGIGFRRGDVDTASALATALLREAAAAGSDVLQTWCSPDDPAAPLWASIGLQRQTPDVRTLVDLRSLDETQAAIAANAANWHFQMGDADGN